MSKTVTFEFWHLNIIDKDENLVKFEDLVKILEGKPLDISQNNHRFQCNNLVCNKAISQIDYFTNGVLVNFCKYLLILLKNLQVFQLLSYIFYEYFKKYLSLHQLPFKILLKLIHLDCNHSVVLYELILQVLIFALILDIKELV